MNLLTSLWRRYSSAHAQRQRSCIARPTLEGLEERALLSASIVEFAKLPSIPASPQSITRGPDGNYYFTEYTYSKIGKMDAAGHLLAEYRVAGFPMGITVGANGNLWFTEYFGNKVGTIKTDGTGFHDYAVGAGPVGITAGPDGKLWFAEQTANKVGTIKTDGTGFQDYAVGRLPQAITTGPDGKIWFTETGINKVGCLNTDGTGLTHVFAGWFPAGITAGPDGNIWVTSGALNSIGKIKTNGTGFTSYPVGMSPSAITSGPDGNIWFSQTYSNSIGQFNPTTSKLTEYVIPTLRSYPGGLAAGPGGPGGALVYFTERAGNRLGAVVNSLTGGVLVSHSVPVGNPVTVGVGGKQASGLVLSLLARGNSVVSPPVVPNAGSASATVVSGPAGVLAGTTPVSASKALPQVTLGHSSTPANAPVDVLFGNFKPALESAL
jgi:streptogramin lyase